MLLLPYQTRLRWASLPLATLALLIANLAVHFLLQRDDARIQAAATDLYVESELPRIEWPRYRAWLSSQRDADARARLRELESMRGVAAPTDLEPVPRSRALAMMMSDARFQRDLRRGRVLSPADPEFSRWRTDRDRFEEVLARSWTERLALREGGNPWTVLTHQFLHGDLGHLIGNLLVLLLAGPFAEAAMGRIRYLAGYLAGGAAAGGLHLLFTPAPLIGASGAISAAMAMVAVIYRLREVPVFYWIGVVFGTARIPALLLLPVWLVNELYQWGTDGQGGVAYGAHVGGLAAGALFAWALRPRDERGLQQRLEQPLAGERQAPSGLQEEARAAAARMDIRRAARLYRELIEQEPRDPDRLLAYFNIALLGHDEETLRDACLRLLWFKGTGPRAEMRKAFLQMGQPRVARVLPIGERLRLARRLVKFREDASALRVLDELIADPQQRTMYGRQIADCLLGLYTTYSRNGLKASADAIQERLTRHFGSPEAIGGLPPDRAPPLTIRTTRPATPTLDLELPPGPDRRP